MSNRVIRFCNFAGSSFALQMGNPRFRFCVIKSADVQQLVEIIQREKTQTLSLINLNIKGLRL